MNYSEFPLSLQGQKNVTLYSFTLIGLNTFLTALYNV